MHVQRQNKTALKCMNCSLDHVSDDLHHQLNLFSHILISLPCLKMTGFQSEFPIILMHSLCVNVPCNLAGWSGYIGNHCSDWHNNTFSHELGGGIYPSSWQIIELINKPSPPLLNCVGHPYDLCSVWDTARPQCNPEYLLLAWIIGKASTTFQVNSHTFGLPNYVSSIKDNLQRHVAFGAEIIHWYCIHCLSFVCKF